MIKFTFSLVGMIAFVAGIGLLFMAYSPRFLGEKRELGGASTTQQIVAADAFGGTYSAENLPDLPVSVDGQAATTNGINAQPVLEGDALSDASALDAAEVGAIEELNAYQVGAVGQNVVINDQTQVEVVPLNVAASTTVDLTGQGGAGFVGRVEQRTVQLEFPKVLRVGGSASVKLTLKTLENGQVEVVPEIPDNAVIATPILLTDYYDTHTAAFTATLIAPDLTVETKSSATQLVERGQEGVWRWSVDAPDDSGQTVLTFDITVFWTPRSGVTASQIGPISVWGQAVQIDADYVFGGISVPQASVLGSALSVIGFVGQSPLIMSVLGYFFRRSNRRQKSRRRQ